jgi:hypothetical protein
MDIQEVTREGATIRFTPEDLTLLTMLVQEGRVSFECDDPVAEALDHGIRSAALRVGHPGYRSAGEA